MFFLMHHDLVFHLCSIFSQRKTATGDGDAVEDLEDLAPVEFYASPREVTSGSEVGPSEASGSEAAASEEIHEGSESSGSERGIPDAPSVKED